MSRRQRYRAIVVLTLLMAAAVWVGGELIVQARADRASGLRPAELAKQPLISQQGQFVQPEQSLRQSATDLVSPISLTDRFARRAYPGAPPFIPHPVETEFATDSRCASCHLYGGWTPHLQAHAPRTPHPELVACRQCHVAQVDTGQFKATTWTASEPPQLRAAALPGSPPPMPHQLEMRESCLACHSGSAAAVELRTTHPERTGCLQCHVEQEQADQWHRGRAEGSTP